MPANKATNAKSDNSVPRPPQDETEPLSTCRDPRLRSIAQHINNHNGAVTLSEIATEAGWTCDETRDHIERMRSANLVQLLDDLQEPVLLLTADGEQFAQGGEL